MGWLLHNALQSCYKIQFLQYQQNDVKFSVQVNNRKSKFHYKMSTLRDFTSHNDASKKSVVVSLSECVSQQSPITEEPFQATGCFGDDNQTSNRNKTQK